MYYAGLSGLMRSSIMRPRCPRCNVPPLYYGTYRVPVHHAQVYIEDAARVVHPAVNPTRPEGGVVEISPDELHGI